MDSPQASASSPRSLYVNFAKGSGLFSIALVAQRIGGIILLPIMTRFLTPADYGVLDLVEQIGTVMATLLGANLGLALGFFYFQDESTEARRRVVGALTLGSAILGAAACLICAPFSSLASRLVFGSGFASKYLLLTFASFVAGFPMEAMFSWLRTTNKLGVYVYGCLFRIGVTIIGTVVLVAGFRLRVWGVLSTSVAAIVLTGLCLTVYCVRRVRPVFDLQMFGRMARFAAPIGIGNLGVFILNVGDRFILPHYRPLSDLGIYVLAYKLGSMIIFVYSPFWYYWGTNVFQIMKRKDSEDVFSRLFTYMLLILSFCAVGLITGARPVLTILAAPAFRSAVAIVPIIVAAYYFRAIGDFVRCLFLAGGRPAYDAVCNWAGAGICLAGYFIMIPKYGIWGAAIATAAAFLFICVVSVAWVYRLWPYRVEKGRLAKIAAATGAGLIPYALLSPQWLPGQIASSALSIAVFLTMLWLLRFPTEGETQELRTAGGLLVRGQFHAFLALAKHGDE
jgi:O-antigen/teichoic acid export membrane protein